MHDDSDFEAAITRLRVSPLYQESWNEAEKNSWNQAWTILVERLWPFVFTVATQALGRRHPLLDPEDLVQDTLRNLAQQWPKVDIATPKDLHAFVAKVTHRKVVDCIRRLYSKRRDIRREQAFPPDQLTQNSLPKTGDPEAERHYQEALEEFQQLFATDEMDRKIIKFLSDGFTQAAAAEELGVDPATVSRRVGRLEGLWLAWLRNAAEERESD